MAVLDRVGGLHGAPDTRSYTLDLGSNARPESGDGIEFGRTPAGRLRSGRLMGEETPGAGRHAQGSIVDRYKVVWT